MIKIGLIEDQVLVREGIANLINLSESHKVRWQSENGQSALEEIKSNPVDLVISDIRMPVMNGIEFVRNLRAMDDKTPVLMLTTFDDHDNFIEALKAGANGFLLKDVSLEKLNQAINKIASGGFLAEPQLIRPLNEPAPEPHPVNLERLSDKEIQILRYIAAGFSNKEISFAIFLAEGTIKNHISNILSKLNCRDRVQAVVKAIQWQLI